MTKKYIHIKNIKNSPSQIFTLDDEFAELFKAHILIIFVNR